MSRRRNPLPKKHLRWLRAWLRRGYTVKQGSTQFILHGPDGEFVTSLSFTPSNPETASRAAQRDVERHEQKRREDTP